MYFRFLLLYLKLVVKATCLFTYIKIYSFNWTNIIDLNKFLFRDWIYIVSWYQSINQSITYRTRDFWVQFFQMDITFFSFMCMFCISLFVLLYFFFSLLCFLFFFDTDSDYPFCIFKLFLTLAAKIQFPNGMKY